MSKEIVPKDRRFEFQVFAWHTDDGQTYPLEYEDPRRPNAEHIEDFNFTVHMFGKTREGESVCIHVKDYVPTFYLHFKKREMNYVHYDEVRAWMERILSAPSQEQDERGRTKWRKFPDHLVEEDSKTYMRTGTTNWGFTNLRKDKYYKFSFKSQWAHDRALGKLKSFTNRPSDMGEDEMTLGGFQLFDVIDPLLRFAHTKDLQTAGWIYIDQRRLQRSTPKTSDCKLEYTVSYDHVHGEVREEICPNLVEMAFDIEVDSVDEKFPKPEIKENVVFQIGITLKRYISKEIEEKILLHYGPLIDPIEGVDVRYFEKEKDLLLEFSKIIKLKSPDLIYTWNGDDFDWNYVYVRAKLHHIIDKFQQMSRINNYQCDVEELNFSSSAMGQNVYKHVRIPGRLNLDALIFTKKDAVNKYDNYKLDTVAAKQLGERKDDVYYKDIFRWFKEGKPEKMAVVGKYCIQDTALVQKLVDKTDVVVQLFEMANITYTQVSDLLIRGQQIKVYSQITKAAMDKGFFTPLMKRQNDDDPLGAIVLEPKVGVYKSPVVCLDFASLYPTIMMAFNMCYSTLVIDEKYANVPGVKYDDIEWVDNGKKIKVRFAQGVTSIIPEIQRAMFQARKDVKKMKKDLIKKVIDPKTGKEIEVCTDELRSRVLTGRELAIKVSMNSIYGFTSAQKMRLALLTGAVTAQGRKMIHQTKDFMENAFPDMCVKEGWAKERPRLEAIGGDSVTADTPVLIRHADKSVEYKRISEIVKTYEKSADGKEVGYLDYPIEVLTEKGFTRIKHVVRHYTDKRMFRVQTQRGVVDVTEDHSLLDTSANKVKPTEVKVGTELLHTDLKYYSISSTTPDFSHQKAFDLGKWYGHQQNLTSALTTMTTTKSSQLNTFHSVPKSILNAPLSYKRSFLHGFILQFPNSYTGDLRNGTLRALEVNLRGKTAIADMYLLLTCLNYKVTLRTPQQGTVQLFAIESDASYVGKTVTKLITKITELPKTEQFVYDIETVNHHFNVGPGEIVVHNTDSVFVHFPDFSIMDAIKLAQIAEGLLTDHVFNREPIRMEYEKVYLPYILIKKKNYIGKKYENDDVKWKLDFKGIALKRRNYCPLLKQIYQGAIDATMENIEDGPDKALLLIKKHLERLEQGEVSYDELVITASLKSLDSYANANLPHVQLAQRMEERDEAVSVGDRLSYVVVADFTKSTELSARSEEVLRAKELKIPIDSLFYVNQQIRKPISAFMTILGKGKEIDKVFNDSEMIIRQRQDHLVQKGYRARNNLQDISSFFKPKSASTKSTGEGENKEEHTKPLPPLSRFKGKGKGKPAEQAPVKTLDSFFKKV